MQEMQETWVWSLGQEDPLEKEMATHSRILAWKIPWTEEPDGLQSMGSQKLDMTEHTQKYLENTQIIIAFMLFLSDSSYHLGMEKVTFEYFCSS